MDKPLVLTNSTLSRLNVGKKRKLHLDKTKDEISKYNRNSGLPYQGRNRQHHPGILPPQEVSLTRLLVKIFTN